MLLKNESEISLERELQVTILTSFPELSSIGDSLVFVAPAFVTEGILLFSGLRNVGIVALALKEKINIIKIVIILTRFHPEKDL